MKFESLLTKIDQLPPCLCRLFARTRTGGGKSGGIGWTPKSHRTIAAESGLPKSTVADLSKKASWSEIPIDVADKFARACGVNLNTIDEAVSRLRRGRTRLRHLAAGNAQQRRMLANLMKRPKKKLATKTNEIPIRKSKS